MKNLIHILLFLILSISGFSQVRVLATNKNFDIKPGAHFTVLFEIYNDIQDPTEKQLVLPAKWYLITQRITTQGSVKKYFFTIGSYNQSMADTYKVKFQVLQGNALLAKETIEVRVEEFRKIEILPVLHPEFAREGDNIKTEYLIQNLGNRTEKLKINTSRGKIEGIKDSVSIEPNSALKVVVKQEIPEGQTTTWQTASDLMVNMSGNPAPIYQAVSIPVFSNKIKQNDPYHRFPVEIGGTFLNFRIGNQNILGYQYLAEGRGFLDAKNKHALDFTVRGPSQIFLPAIGTYDQYSLSYSYRSKTNLWVGDYLLRFNNLMEFGRFGRGAMIEQHIRKTKFTGFYQEARFFPDQKSSFGGSITQNFKNGSSISANYISKYIANQNRWFWSNIAGISSKIKGNILNIETEVAVSEALKKNDIGGFNRINFSWKRLHINSDVIYAGKNFYGFYNNSLLLINGISLNITPKINIGVNSNITRINPSLDANAFSLSPFSSTHMAFLSYQPNAKNLLFLNFTHQERQDRQEPSTFHYKEDFGNLTYSLNATKFTLFTQGRYGYANNLLIKDEPAKRQSFASLVQPSVRFLKWLWVGGYFEHQRTSKFSANNSIQDLFFYGGSVKLNYKKFVSLNFMYRNNFAPDEFFEKRSFMDASLVLDFKRHYFSFNAGRAYIPNLPQNEQNTLFFNAKYALKLNVPLKKNKNLGQISGYVYSTNPAIRKDGLLIQLGDKKYLTDSTGHFHFTNLNPNQYFISMSRSAIHSDVISEVKLPLVVDIKADSTHKIRIPLVKTGGIIGKVIVENNNTKPDILNQNPEKPIVLIKLVSEHSNLLTQVNAKNEFSFKEIRPSEYKVIAMIVGENERFIIENPERLITLESGKLEEINFVLRQVERKIYFSNQVHELSLKK